MSEISDTPRTDEREALSEGLHEGWGLTLARQLERELNALLGLFTHERLAQLDNLVTAAEEARNVTIDEGEELFTWIDTIRKAIPKAKEGPCS